MYYRINPLEWAADVMKMMHDCINSLEQGGGRN